MKGKIAIAYALLLISVVGSVAFYFPERSAHSQFSMRVENAKNDLRAKKLDFQNYASSNPDEPDEVYEVHSIEELTKAAKLLNQTTIYTTPACDLVLNCELFVVEVVSCKAQSAVAAALGQCSEFTHSEIRYRMYAEGIWLYGKLGFLVMVILGVLSSMGIICGRTTGSVGNTPSKGEKA